MPVIRTVPSPSKGQAAKLVLPECVNDVFARSGIRWYENGPYDGRINYWRREPSVPYSEGRAAKRLISQGYRCDATQLYDPNEIIV
ncbi:TPA: hypothetical protein N0F65_001202 [Lagenidium giganteum]|uniref:Uncharacterized protein n=1 Tax=Lagenidium giganteum TaxID=4803 RepID=A0AAV2Z090_9STRA|nr:TPA: hypothetical protein N0F65_001202 [Lagenidium giganteum]